MAFKGPIGGIPATSLGFSGATSVTEYLEVGGLGVGGYLLAFRILDPVLELEEKKHCSPGCRWWA